jgi:hypothetical protein
MVELITLCAHRQVLSRFATQHSREERGKGISNNLINRLCKQ